LLYIGIYHQSMLNDLVTSDKVMKAEKGEGSGKREKRMRRRKMGEGLTSKSLEQPTEGFHLLHH
jgi:hypothetical protein